VLLSNPAYEAHLDLSEKHFSFLHSKPTESMQCIFEYQYKLNPRCKGFVFNGKEQYSLAEKLFSMIKAKRAKRNDFITSIVNMLEPKTGGGSQEYYCSKFISEALATLKYDIIEEVSHLNSQLELKCCSLSESIDEEDPTVQDVLACLHLELIDGLRKYIIKRYGLETVYFMLI
jgi:hypothetical protein